VPESSVRAVDPVGRDTASGTGFSGLDVVLVLTLLSAVFPWTLSSSIQPSWTRDLVSFVVLTACAFAGGLLRGGRDWRLGLVLAFAAMCTVGLIVWVIQGGSSFGLNFWAGWSPWLLSPAFLVFGFTFGPSRWHVWRRVLIVFGVLVAAVQDIGILGKALGVIGTEASRFGDFYAMRTIHASLALFIVLAYLLVLAEEPAGRAQATLAVFLGVSVVVSQHRSVWVALTIITLLMLVHFARTGASRDRWVGLIAPFAYLVAANLLPVVGIHLLPRGGETAPERGLADAATSSNSLDWRLEMWRTRLAAARDPDHWIFGGVLRVNPVKWPGEGVMNPYNSAHNMFIDVSVMLGLVGVLVVLGMFVAGTILRRDRLAPTAVFLWGLLGYGLFYYWPSWSWVVIGVALAAGRAQPPEREAPP
jgi:hypothetical protein